MTELLAPYLPLLAYCLVLLFVTLYAVLSSIEFGSAVLLTMPEPPISRKAIERYFGPAWESTNVFLVFSLVGLVMFFPHVLPYLAALYAPAGIALLFFVIRVLGIFGVFYTDSTHRAFALLFALGSLGAPLTLSIAYYVFLTGLHPAFPPSMLLLAIWGAVASTILMLASAFALHIARSYIDAPRLEHIRLAASGFFILCAMPILWFSPAPSETGAAPALLTLGFLFAVALAIIAGSKRHPFLAFCLHGLSVALLIWGVALSHLPYLIYPALTIDAAFTAPEMFMAMLSVVPFGLVVAIPAVGLLWHLFARSPILER